MELSSLFVSLESPAEACGNGDASFYLQKARMSFIKAHAFKPVQQADTMGNGVIVRIRKFYTITSFPRHEAIL